jgi:hypothetical protein
MELNEVACVVALGVLVQFVAAILGPRVLTAASLLMILGAAAVAGYLVYEAVGANFAGIGQDAQALATVFGGIAVGLIITHFIMRALFRGMARMSQA